MNNDGTGSATVYDGDEAESMEAEKNKKRDEELKSSLEAKELLWKEVSERDEKIGNKNLNYKMKI